MKYKVYDIIALKDVTGEREWQLSPDGSLIGNQDNEFIVVPSIGAFDKNGVDIYEGDIVEYKYGVYGIDGIDDVLTGVGEVYFEDGQFIFDRKTMFTLNDNNFYPEHLNVIGNIHAGDFIDDGR